MSGPEFFRTRMGHKFFQNDVPKIADGIGRLADNVAALNATLQRLVQPPEPKRLRVLLVDNEDRILRALQRVLKRHHDASLAATPKGALDAVANHAIDVVVTDFDLNAEHDGLWLLEQVKTRHPSVRRILMSGSAPPMLEEQIQSGVVQRFLGKPVSHADMLAALREGEP